MVLIRNLVLGLTLALATLMVQGQELTLRQSIGSADATESATIVALARDALAIYRDEARAVDLNQRFRLQIVAGQDREALASIIELRALREFSDEAQRASFLLPYQVFLEARLLSGSADMPFERAFSDVFGSHFEPLDDRTAEQAQFGFGAYLPGFEQQLAQAIERHAGKSTLELGDALELVRSYLMANLYARLLPLAEVAIHEDDARRYAIDTDVIVTTPEGARISALVIRPKSARARLPTLLNFSIYADNRWKLAEAKRSAANGYAAVAAFSRGKGASPDVIVPYEHDGKDATAVIDWISRQPWSDGRVGMFGGSYEGFTQWAAAKHRHPALKGIMPMVAAAPGIDVPMEGGVFQTFVYRWIPHVTNNSSMDYAVNNDHERWQRMEHDWYQSGRPYRELDRIDGTPSPIFQRWLEHPTYDEYWQRMLPYKAEFSAIDIPVLQVSGYFDGALVSTLYYFDALEKYRPQHEQYLLIGPYDHFGAQSRAAPVVQGYTIDPSAQLDMVVLRYQWFDYLFRGAARPAALQDRINYQVMGADRWRHAGRLADIGQDRRRYFFGKADKDGQYRLQASAAVRRSGIRQRVDFRQRETIEPADPPLIIRNELDTDNAIVFITDAMTAPVELEGRFSGDLHFISNRRDFDFTVSLYQRTPEGEHFELGWFLSRASQLRDRGKRQLLRPGRRERLEFRSDRPVARLLAAGSQLVLVLAINKHSGAQINHGSGKDVSDESIKDADVPLRIQWLGSSSFELPFHD